MWGADEILLKGFLDMKSTAGQAKVTENQVLGGADTAAAEEEAQAEISELFEGIMEGYQDCVIPPLSDFSPTTTMTMSTNHAPINDKAVGPSSSRYRRERAPSNEEAEPNTLKERKRRGKMAEMYSVLQSMVVPPPFCKTTREGIVSRTIEHIQKLEKEIARLEDLKNRKNNSIALLPDSSAGAKAMPSISRCTSRSSSIAVNVYGGVTCFGVQSPFRRGLVTKIFRVLERHQVEVLTANVAVDDRRLLSLTTTAMIGGNKVEETIEKMKGEILVILEFGYF